jgi:hypothetical protein
MKSDGQQFHQYQQNKHKLLYLQRYSRDRMVVGFTTTYAINALSALIFCFVFCFFQGEVYNIM